jgi:hypothetical protein
LTEQELGWIGRTFNRKPSTWKALYEQLSQQEFEIAKQIYLRYNSREHWHADSLTLRDVERRLSILSRVAGGLYVEQKVVRVDGVVYSYDVKAYRKRNGGD